MTEDNEMELYYQEIHDVMLSHDGAAIEEFAKKWGLSLRNNKYAVTYSHLYVVQNVFFTEEERAASRKWLEDRGKEYLITDVKVMQ